MRIAGRSSAECLLCEHICTTEQSRLMRCVINSQTDRKYSVHGEHHSVQVSTRMSTFPCGCISLNSLHCLGFTPRAQLCFSTTPSGQRRVPEKYRAQFLKQTRMAKKRNNWQEQAHWSFEFQSVGRKMAVESLVSGVLVQSCPGLELFDSSSIQHSRLHCPHLDSSEIFPLSTAQYLGPNTTNRFVLTECSLEKADFLWRTFILVRNVHNTFQSFRKIPGDKNWFCVLVYLQPHKSPKLTGAVSLKEIQIATTVKCSLCNDTRPETRHREEMAERVQICLASVMPLLLTCTICWWAH